MPKRRSLKNTIKVAHPYLLHSDGTPVMIYTATPVIAKGAEETEQTKAALEHSKTNFKIQLRRNRK